MTGRPSDARLEAAQVEQEEWRIRPGASPLHVRAVMARRGLLSGQLVHYEDVERGYVNPLNEQETQGSVRVFMSDLDKWLADAADAVSEPTPRPCAHEESGSGLRSGAIRTSRS